MNSLEELAAFIKRGTPRRIEVTSLTEVFNVYEETRTETLERELNWKGLFAVAVSQSPDESSFVLYPSLETFTEALKDVIEKG